MSVPLTIQGVTFNYPQQFDTNWGPTLTNWSTAVTNALKALPSTGVLTLSPYPTAAINFANATNSGFLVLTTNASNQLTFQGNVLNTLTLPVSVTNGGTGDSSLTAYAVLCGGTTPTGPLQQVSGVGLTGQALVSNGASLLPTWQNVSGSGTVNTGTAGQIAYYAATGTTISGSPLLSETSNQLLLVAATGPSVISARSSDSTSAELALTSSGFGSSFIFRNAGTGNLLFRDDTNAVNFLAYTFSGTGLLTSNVPISMASNPIVNLTNGVLSTDATAFGQVQYGFQNALYFQIAASATNATTSFASTGIALNFTPTNSNSRVKITITGTFSTPNNSTVGTVTIFRGGTNLAGGSSTAGFAVAKGTAAGAYDFPTSITVIDAPATTSATLYAIYIRSNGSGTVTWGADASFTSFVIEELR